MGERSATAGRDEASMDECASLVPAVPDALHFAQKRIYQAAFASRPFYWRTEATRLPESEETCLLMAIKQSSGAI